KVAYVCTCSSEEFKEFVSSQTNCPCRKNSPKENLTRWKKMLDKKGYKEGKAVLLFKSNLKDPKPALRDFPLARINEKKHPKKGNKYRVWPLMNLSVSFDDMEDKMTHIIRAKEHRFNSLRQAMIFKVFKKKAPEALFLGRYKFIDLELSCSKTKKLIQKKKYSGWEDIRLPFLTALQKRGYQPDTFRKIAEIRGISEVDKVMSKEDYFKVLDDINREILKNKARKIEFSDKKAKGFVKVSIIMSDGKRKSGYARGKVKDGEIIHFLGLGYAKLNGKEFWFTHK
ncbi:MAG: hypothetical protein JSW08_02035, partial [archaeon]